MNASFNMSVQSANHIEMPIANSAGKSAVKKNLPSIAHRGFGDTNGFLHILKAVVGIRLHENQSFISNETHQKVKRFMPGLNGSLLIPMAKMKHFNIHFCPL